MVKVVLRSTVAAVALMAGLSHIAAAAPITSNWTPGNAGNWSGSVVADGINWTHSSAPATTTSPSNTGGDTFTVNIDNGGGAASTVNLNADVTIDQLNVSSGDTLNLNNSSDLTFVNGTTLTNNGNINLNSSGALTRLNFSGATTLTGAGTITLGNDSSNQISQAGGGAVITHGANHTIRGAGNLLGNNGGLDNAGAIIADQSTALILDPGLLPVNNTGTLGAQSGGQLTLNGGTFNNAGGVISADGAGSVVNLSSSAVVVNGGTLTTTNFGQIRSVANGALLNGVATTAGTNIVLDNSHDLRITNGLANNGTINLNSTAALTDVFFQGTQTLTGTGEIVMGQNGGNRVIVNANATVLTLDADQTIRGAGQILANSGGFINEGQILQQGAVALIIDPGSPDVDGNGANFVNNNVLRSEGTGGLTLNGAVYQNNTTIESTGGGDIRLASSSTEIRGGSLTASGGGVIRSVGNGAVLDSVTITGGTSLVLDNAEDIRFRATTANNVNDGTINLNSTGGLTDVFFQGTQTLTGTGEIVIGQNGGNRVIVNANATVLTLDADQTIRGAGQILANSGGFVNQGAIIADSASDVMRIDAGTNFSNLGTLRATGAAGFDVDGGAAFTQAGGLVDIRAGSRIDMTARDYVQTGGHTQVDGTLRTQGIGTNVIVQGGTFGGTGLVDFDGTGVHALNNTGGMITAGASPGTLTIQDGNFVQGSGGTFEFELDGFVAGVGHDLLNIVNGDADMGGDLSIVADQLFASTLSIGDQFEVVRLDQLGTFIDGDLVNGADVFDNIFINLGGLDFIQLFIGNSLFIEVAQADVLPPGVDPIPEPESLVLMMLGLTAIFWMRRRRVTLH